MRTTGRGGRASGLSAIAVETRTRAETRSGEAQNNVPHHWIRHLARGPMGRLAGTLCDKDHFFYVMGHLALLSSLSLEYARQQSSENEA